MRVAKTYDIAVLLKFAFRDALRETPRFLPGTFRDSVFFEHVPFC